MRHLKAFHVFHIAAESSSYSVTADKLHITHGAVSKQIKLLETYLSLPLFYKKGRGMVLTPDGELLKQYTNVAFDALDQGIIKLRSTKNNYLEISCEPTLTMRWLMPRLSDYYNLSGTDIRLSTAGGPITLGEAGLSMAIRRDDFDIPSDYVVQKLVEEWVGPVCSKEYWNKVQHDYSNITLLHSKTRPSAWNNWLMKSNNGIHLNKSNQSFDHFYFCLQAAADGLGAAIGSYPLVADDLTNGRLVAPFGFILSGHNYVLLRQSSELGTKEEHFQHWLKNKLSKCVPDN
ncbi:LysR family transcriptional regulator [Pseudoalteromonas piscicida]|uniref:LysR family transcriptional regulator n=1 Tax=Pseudoalteromonas piscicida TaxID=43662 RepID=A0AAQ2ERN2_PSEO7|nr:MULTISPECIES: LysR family transcriptional regulator [Pseudoalteromonas]KJY89981.1 LysR family transcriptional regulator [Pseudoalteromonas piscicida]MDP4489468.1 LysR family transcriptional regulator [Pseudoalteromonas piscicida]TMN39287.1 LysR family transcriptional regulator [Pseudoalteromonas piscicida]TMN40578.1 LysR family transcriptional regulator [Pseudoalteromonas piscicida]TMN49885.1 LysR family transcriptional regulator [Pseudoalteromonas piscicida]